MVFIEIMDYYYLLENIIKKEHLIALTIFISAVIVLKIFKYFIISRIKKLASYTKTQFDDLLIKIIDKIGWPFYLVFSLYFAIKFTTAPGIIKDIVFYFLLVVSSYYFVKSFEKIIDYWFHKLKSKSEDPSIISLSNKVIKIILWGVVVVIILQNLGYNISALVAGLGIGGLAIAFAIQNILADIFASFSIYFDKPFKIGDFIIVGNDMGTVKKIGVKSTRIQTLQGEELIISNKELTESRIHNYKKMEKRRIVFNIGVLYETSNEKLKMIPDIVKDIILDAELAEIDRVHFNSFKDSSLNFEVVYYLKSSDYNDYMNTQQYINLAIKKRFEKEEIEFAYPTYKIFLDR